MTSHPPIGTLFRYHVKEHGRCWLGLVLSEDRVYWLACPTEETGIFGAYPHTYMGTFGGLLLCDIKVTIL